MINYYHYMWKKRSELLAPLTSLTSTESKWDWIDKHQKVFDAIKNIISRKTLLSYPDFTNSFDIHTDASDLHMGAVIRQNKNQLSSTAENQIQLKRITLQLKNNF